MSNILSEISLYDTIYKLKDDNAVTQEQLEEALANVGNTSVVIQAEEPTDTSVIWIDPDDNNADELDIVKTVNHIGPDENGNIKLDIDMSTFDDHINNKNNPHEVTAEQIGALSLTKGGTVTGKTTFVNQSLVCNSAMEIMGYHEQTGAEKPIVLASLYDHINGYPHLYIHGKDANNSVSDVKINVGTPVRDNHAANKAYVDTNFAKKSDALLLSGGNVTGDTSFTNISSINLDLSGCLSLYDAISNDNSHVEICYFSDDNEIMVMPTGTSGTPTISAGTPIKTEHVANKKYVDDAIYTKITTDATSGNKSITLTSSNSNSEWRYVYASGITSLTLTSSGTFSNTDEAYYTVIFISGTTATTITNTFGAYFSGDDCVDGVFTPAASKTYDLGIWWNGVKWQVAVRGSV